MKHLPVLLAPVCFAVALPLIGCTTQEAQIRSSGTMGQSDAEFVLAAYQVAQLDEQAGKLAASRASDPRVADLASRMSSEASVLYPNLQAALRAEGKPVPTAMPSSVTVELQKLQGLQGAAFDREFVAAELAVHTQAVAALQKEDASTKDSAMRTQVETELPAVQGNLATLQFLSTELNPKKAG